MAQRSVKSTKRSFEAPESFLFRIDGIEPEYSFGIGHSRFDVGAYSEHSHTEIITTCLVPAKLAGRTTKFTLIGDRRIAADLAQPKEAGAIPNGIGTLTMRGQQSEYLGAMPFDALASVASLIVAGGLRVILLSGPPLSRGSSRIDYMNFKTEADPDDY